MWEKRKRPNYFMKETKNVVKMQTQPLNFEKDWITVDITYPEQMELRKELLNTKLSDVYEKGLGKESTELAKKEVLQLLMDYLPKRYPLLFEKTENGVYSNYSRETIRYNPNEDPLITCSSLASEDLCILEYSEEHKQYVLTSAVLCFPMRWKLNEKMNLPLISIHLPVQAYQKHLASRVNHLFESISVEKGFTRGNWALFHDLRDHLDLFTPASSLQRQSDTQKIVYGPDTGKKIIAREEYQSLIRLPRSNAILFTIKTYQWYLEEIKDFPEEAYGLIEAIQNLNPDMSEYKTANYWSEATIEYLRKEVLSNQQSNSKL